jgi:serine/threonine protein kinase
VRLEDGWQVAVKVVALDKLINRQNVTLLKGEIKISKMIKHPNIVEVFDIVQSLNNIYIISELCEGGDLKQLFSQRNGLTELEALRLISDVFAGLKYLFSKNIIH